MPEGIETEGRGNQPPSLFFFTFMNHTPKQSSPSPAIVSRRATRVYGNPPRRIALLHGGPGAPGTMAPVARELETTHGVLEPLQTANSLEGQLGELHESLQTHADPPVTLIGHSWGAMLGFLFAARHPHFVRKLILVASGVFDPRHAERIESVRLARLAEHERSEMRALTESLRTGERLPPPT